ncbi:MAG TPA: HAD family phosphatase [Polyangiaceae bacterium]|nr:HAD family phosphatase [Polyangiaceae bacterium]
MKAAVANIDTIVFDLFGVLISFDNDLVYARLAAHCAAPNQALIQLEGLMARPEIITGKRTLVEIHRELVEAHGLTLSFPAFEAAWLAPYHESMAGMRELVANLSQRYQLALLSNIDGYYWPIVRDSQPELAHFAALFLSFELGLAKPNPEIFGRVCQLSQTSPERCYFVDDTLVNVEAARALGFKAHCFGGIDALTAELHALGLTG